MEGIFLSCCLPVAPVQSKSQRFFSKAQMKPQKQIRTLWSSEDSVCVAFLGGVKCGPLPGYKNLPIMAVTFGSKGKDTAGCHGTDTREFKHDNCAMSGLQKKILRVVWMSSEGCDIFRLMLSSAEQSNFRTCKRPFFQKTPLVVQCLHTHTPTLKELCWQSGIQSPILAIVES